MYFTITLDWLENNKTQSGGYTSLQIKALGWVDGIKTPNWKKRSVGKMITDEQRILFESLSQESVSKTKARKVVLSIKKKESQSVKSAKVDMRKVETADYKRDWGADFIASQAFLATHEWSKVRMQALTKYGNWCHCCGAKPSKEVMLCVDHILPRKFFPKLALDINNLQILCSTCNMGKGNGFPVNWNNTYTVKHDQDSHACT